ncbi:MAG: flagellar export protein FliJ [Candidatus Zixiibacteriota bacterium]
MAAKRFKFRLEPLLKIRQHREKERQKDHAAAVHEVVRQKDLLLGIDHERVDTLDYQRRRLSGRISVAEALVCSRYLVKLKRQRMAGTNLLHGLETEAERKRQKLVEAARDRKMYELLKDKQQLRHRRELEKQEQKQLDEVAVTAFRRHKS